LEQKKLIQIKTGAGGGTVICPVNIQPVSDSLDLLLRYQKISLRELAEFREAVEGLVAARAALKAKKEDINQLNAILESIKKHLDSGMFEWDEIMREDSKFHLYLATIAGNRVFESVLFTIYDNINRYFNQFLPRTNRIFLNIYKDLFNITQAIKERDSNKALAIVQNHVKKFNRMMETGEKGQKGQKGKAAIHEE